MKKMLKMMTLIALTLTLVACGKPETEMKTTIETFSFDELAAVGLVVNTATLPYSASESLYITCDHNTPARADERIRLLSKMDNWVSQTKGTLSLDGTEVSKADIMVITSESIQEFERLDPSDTSCPNLVLASIYL